MANQHHNSNQDIDLAMVSGRIRGYITRVNDSFFNGILFLKRNIILLVILIVAGAALGYYLDQGKKVYEQKIIAMPNFGSVDYLYDNIKMLNQKIEEGDSEFLNSIGIEAESPIRELKIEPVIEIYDFIDDEDDEQQRKMQVFKLLAESDNIEDVLENMPTARNYTKHMITIYTAGTAKREAVVDPIIKYLNADPYFMEMQGEYIKNLETEIVVNDSTLAQINAMLNDFSAGSRKGSGNLIYYNDNTPLHEVIRIKNKLLRKQAENKVNLINYSTIIKENSVVLNIKKKSIVSGNMKFILPILFIFFFIIIAMFIGYYRRQMNKRKLIVTHE